MDSTNHNSGDSSPLLKLPREDQDLIVELVLKSGSLKDLAGVYGVSYPTIRGRLDKVIGRLAALVSGRPRDPVSEMLASLVERGELSPSGARAIRDVVRRTQDPRAAVAAEPTHGPESPGAQRSKGAD